MLGYADYVFTSVFTVEIVLKVIVVVAESVISSTLDRIVLNCVSSLPRSCLDDGLRSFSAHWLLLQKCFQPSRPAGRQRVTHVLLSTVSGHLSNTNCTHLSSDGKINRSRFPSVVLRFFYILSVSLPNLPYFISFGFLTLNLLHRCSQFKCDLCGQDPPSAASAQASSSH